MDQHQHISFDKIKLIIHLNLSHTLFIYPFRYIFLPYHLDWHLSNVNSFLILFIFSVLHQHLYNILHLPNNFITIIINIIVDFYSTKESLSFYVYFNCLFSTSIFFFNPKSFFFFTFDNFGACSVDSSQLHSIENYVLFYYQSRFLFQLLM